MSTCDFIYKCYCRYQQKVSQFHRTHVCEFSKANISDYIMYYGNCVVSTILFRKDGSIAYVYSLNRHKLRI